MVDPSVYVWGPWAIQTQAVENVCTLEFIYREKKKKRQKYCGGWWTEHKAPVIIIEPFIRGIKAAVSPELIVS